VAMPTIVVQENEKHKTVKFNREIVTIGREINCTVQIMDESASRKHIRIEPHGGGWTVEDLESRNGTYLNEILFQGRKPLNDGDVLRIGKVQIRFQGPVVSVAQAVHFLSSPNVINLFLIGVIGAAIGGVGWYIISTLNQLTAQRDKEVAAPVTRAAKTADSRKEDKE
jgi:pSer/pThr/pTyr-binding forkhead associated (FHA) protein